MNFLIAWVIMNGVLLLLLTVMFGIFYSDYQTIVRVCTFSTLFWWGVYFLIR